MTMTPELHAYLSGLPGRCSSCCWHVEKQGGHAPSCEVPAKLGERGMARTSASHPGDAKRTDNLIANFARLGIEFSANDLRPSLAGVKGSVIGSRFSFAAKRGLIREVGRVRSTDPATHGHKISLWQGAGRT